MFCRDHGDQVAVGQCQQCGCAVCSECAAQTELLRDDIGTLCVECFNKQMNMFACAADDERKKMLFRAICCIAFYVAGIICFILYGEDVASGVLMPFIALALMGIVPAWIAGKAIERSNNDAGVRRYYITLGGDIKQESNFSWLAFFAVLILGGVLTPACVIYYFIRANKFKKYVGYFVESLIRDADIVE